MKNSKLVILLTSIVALTIGPSANAYVSGGHEYDLSCNANGFVLSSKRPVSRAIGSGADTRYVTENEKIFLGKECDAYHKLYGYGRWCWGNGGFNAEIGRSTFGFPRQELYCPKDDDLGNQCGC